VARATSLSPPIRQHPTVDSSHMPFRNNGTPARHATPRFRRRRQVELQSTSFPLPWNKVESFFFGPLLARRRAVGWGRGPPSSTAGRASAGLMTSSCGRIPLPVAHLPLPFALSHAWHRRRPRPPPRRRALIPHSDSAAPNSRCPRSTESRAMTTRRVHRSLICRQG
jgi:hypothetical protein